MFVGRFNEGGAEFVSLALGYCLSGFQPLKIVCGNVPRPPMPRANVDKWSDITRATNVRILARSEAQPWAREAAACQRTRSGRPRAARSPRYSPASCRTRWRTEGAIQKRASCSNGSSSGRTCEAAPTCRLRRSPGEQDSK